MKIFFLKYIDKSILISSVLLLVIGVLLVSSVSPSIATRIGIQQNNYFIYHHIVYTLLAMCTMVSLIFIPIKYVKYIGIFGSVVCTLLIILLFTSDVSIKGAKRWIAIFGFSLQPSEFLKVFFSIFVATFVARDIKNLYWIVPYYLFISTLILLEPDFGSYLTLSVTFISQLFFSSLSIVYIALFCAIVLTISLGAYVTMPHIKTRVHKFLFPESEMNYQVSKSIDALSNGGLFGVGPGEGTIKNVLPDAHTDFIFSVGIEEFGLLLGVVIVLLYMIIIIKSIVKITKIPDNFIVIAVMGIVTQISIQSIVNLGVGLNLFPTKGMTLPLISYGGSSMIAMSINIGCLLCLSRQISIINYCNSKLKANFRHC